MCCKGGQAWLGLQWLYPFAPGTPGQCCSRPPTYPPGPTGTHLKLDLVRRVVKLPLYRAANLVGVRNVDVEIQCKFSHHQTMSSVLNRLTVDTNSKVVISFAFIAFTKDTYTHTLWNLRLQVRDTIRTKGNFWKLLI